MKSKRNPFSNVHASCPIHLHIERIVLEGLPISSHSQELLKTALEAELSRQMATGDIPSTFLQEGAISHVAGGSLQVQSETNPAQLGMQIAQAIYASVGGETSPARESI